MMNVENVAVRIYGRQVGPGRYRKENKQGCGEEFVSLHIETRAWLKSVLAGERELRRHQIFKSVFRESAVDLDDRETKFACLLSKLLGK